MADIKPTMSRIEFIEKWAVEIGKQLPIAEGTKLRLDFIDDYYSVLFIEKDESTKVMEKLIDDMSKITI